MRETVDVWVTVGQTAVDGQGHLLGLRCSGSAPWDGFVDAISSLQREGHDRQSRVGRATSNEDTTAGDIEVVEVMSQKVRVDHARFGIGPHSSATHRVEAAFDILNELVGIGCRPLDEHHVAT